MVQSEVPLDDNSTQCNLLTVRFLAALLGGQPHPDPSAQPMGANSIFDLVSASEDHPEPTVKHKSSFTLLRKWQRHKLNSPLLLPSVIAAELREPASPGLVGVNERQESPYNGVLCPNSYSPPLHQDPPFFLHGMNEKV